ncbi:MAG: prepilin peptidase [Lachnospiraceae bacterium]|nr:prepilin peptidase [Lachnospiraceae bacterium]
MGYTFVLVSGLLIGSFLNVCIYRIPKHENITTTRSHCMSCGNVIKWYDLVPVLSYLLLRGRRRNCGAKLSIQYPIIELLNGII